MRRFRFPVLAVVLGLWATPALAQPSVPFGDAGLHAVQFVDESEGWAVGDDGVVWHSIDGGANWERLKTGTRASLRGLHFLTPYTGWVVGRTELPNGGGSASLILKTTDGGLTWEEVAVSAFPGLNAVHFFDQKNGVICGDSSSAFPSGIFTTADGGHMWKPLGGVKLPSCRGMGFFDNWSDGIVVGAWSRLGKLETAGGKEPRNILSYKEAELDPLAGRSLHAVSTCSALPGSIGSSGPAFAVGDGGAVLISHDRGKKWGFANLGLSPEVVAACDFRCVACYGSNVWVAGRPGGFVLHSADMGRTWEIQRMDLPLPVNGLFFLNEKLGWMVGELGAIYGTVDGGKTWKLRQAGAQRAAVLSLHASLRTTPLDVVAQLGLGDGYICASQALMSADPATADSKRASDAARLRQAMRLAGGAAGDCGWAFPLSPHASGLAPRELMASWDYMHGGKAAEQLLRQAVLAIRIWQPEVVLTDPIATDGPAADVLVLHAAKEAFKQAADPNCFPEQIATLGLKPWSAKKLYALTANAQSAQVRLDECAFCVGLADTPRDFAEPATRVLATDSAATDRRAFVLVAHRLQDADKQMNLMDGISLGRGGLARRAQDKNAFDPSTVEERKRAVQARRQLETIAAATDIELAGPEKVLGMLTTELKKMPDDIAARTAYGLASRLAREGKWAEAREVFGLLASQYPGHPLGIEGYRWLVRYHASSEARRRIEIQQKLRLESVTFQNGDGNSNIRLASGVAGAGPAVHEDSYHLHSPEAITQWHQTCLNLEPKITAYGPLYSRDPSSWLCFLAARRQVGRRDDAITFVQDYFRNNPGLADIPPGTDPWRDCLAAELWLTHSNQLATQPKPLAVARHAELHPMLDGRLDDACWKDNQQNLALVLKAVPGTDDRPDEAKAFQAAYRTEARFAYDDRFLYIAVTCSHPAGKKVEQVAKRTRDADLRGHDRVDILLDLDRDYQTYYRFQIDHRGCLAEDCWGDKTWDPKYFVGFNSTDTGWTAEMAIPLIELTGDRPSHGIVWAANVSRIVPGKGMQTWSGPADNDPRPEGMGLLQFRADK